MGLKKFLKKSREVLGMNARILEYMRAVNSAKKNKLADNKLRVKKLLAKNGINIPHTYGVIRNKNELFKFNWTKLPKSFALKPNMGLGGEGILIVYGRNKKTGNWLKADSSEVTIGDLKTRVMNILDGNYSIANAPDIAFFEERVKILPLFKPYAYKGAPDIRIIVYNKVPVMAMLRLPTKKSEGKANLHLGAVGIGIDIGTGKTTNAVLKGQIIETLPGTRLKLRGIQAPNWDDILFLAVKTQKVLKLGFVGIDISIDRDEGPLILEANARPGLSIQLANLSPLKKRLERVTGLKIKNIDHGIEIAKSLFSQERNKEDAKKIIGVKESIQVFDDHGEKHDISAKIDTGAYRTAISKELAREFGLEKPLYYKKIKSALGQEERPIVELIFILKNKKIKTEASIATRHHLKWDMIIGRRDLKDFLIKPEKNIIKR